MTQLTYEAVRAKREAGGRIEVEDLPVIRAHNAAKRAARLRGQETDKPTAATASARNAAKPSRQAPTPTAEQLAQARRLARHNAVMNSPQAKDRQGTAAGLLGGAPNLSAEQIIAILPTMPTDAQAIESAKRARAAAAWDRVIARTWPNHAN